MICARDSSAILHFTLYILHSKGQNLAEAVQKGRWNEEPGNPERIPARTQQRIVASVETSPKLGKRDTKVALRGLIPRGVSSDHVYRGRLAMPPLRRENVRHATLLFCAEGVNVRTNWHRKGETQNELQSATISP